MRNVPRNQQIPVAVDNHSRIDLSFDVYSTTDFFKPFVSFCKEVVPGDHINTKVESFVRLAPLARPTLSQMNLHTHLFFVPFRVIFPRWNEFITQNADQHLTLTDSVPYTTLGDLATIFTSNNSIAYQTESTTYDFIGRIGTDTPKKYLLTNEGRHFLQILNGLGYELSFFTYDTTKVSMLPLFAYAKVFHDWFYPSQYLSDSLIPSILFKSDYQDGRFSVTPSDITTLIRSITRMTYEKDFLTSLWSHPNGPYTSGTYYNGLTINDISLDSFSLDSAKSRISVGNGTPFVTTGNTSTVYPSRPTQYILNALESLTKFMKRNQVTGYRPMERMLARYGVRLDDTQTHRSVLLGSQINPIQISDVMATSDTAGAVLGDYAGKGIAYESGQNFNLDSKEFGCLIAVTSVIPHVATFGGLQKENTHVKPLDYFTPEFDNLGVQAVARQEVQTLEQDWSLAGQNTFGFAPRYNEYKYSKDLLLGDFRVKHIQATEDINSFVISRDPNLNGKTYIDKDLIFGDPSAYNGIFNYIGSDADHFYIVQHVNMHANRPMSSMSDVPLLEDDDSGHNVNLPYEGLTLN